MWVCVLKGPQHPKGRGGKLSYPPTFSSCSMQGVCTTILQAAHFLRDTDFCCRTGKRGPLRHQVSLSRRLPASAQLPSVCTGKPQSWRPDKAPAPLTILGRPTAGVLGSGLDPTFPEKGSGCWLHQQGAACPSKHSPASWLHNTAPQRSRSPRTRWSRTRCAPHMSLTPGHGMGLLSACWLPSPPSHQPLPTRPLPRQTRSSALINPALFRLPHCPNPSRLGSPSCLECLHPPTAPWPRAQWGWDPGVFRHSRSSPLCSGSAALTRCTGPQGWAEAGPGAGGPT